MGHACEVGLIDLSYRVDRTMLGRLESLRGQARFAAALALTRTAQAAQRRIRERELPRVFTIRSRWVPGGIRIRPATKADLAAKVGSVTPFMALHESGGTRGPTTDRGQNVAVPTRALRRSPGSRIGLRQHPGALLDRPGHFIHRGPRGSSVRRRVRGGVRVLYWLTPSVEVDDRIDFDRIAGEVVEETFAGAFAAAYLRALRTARR